MFGHAPWLPDVPLGKLFDALPPATLAHLHVYIADLDRRIESAPSW